jgi:colicin import membrane protein
MPRKLRVYQTSQGFYDLVVAAPSMKAAAEAWGTSPDIFQQGFAKHADDRDVITAAMAQPGVVLRRPVGSNRRFQEHAELPTAESLSAHFRRNENPRKKAKAKKLPKAEEQGERHTVEVAERRPAEKADEEAERKAAASFEKAVRKRELQRRKEEATATRARARRHAAIEKAKSALESARRKHNERTATIEKDRAAIERRAKEEETRWKKLESRLEAALRKASR